MAPHGPLQIGKAATCFFCWTHCITCWTTQLQNLSVRQQGDLSGQLHLSSSKYTMSANYFCQDHYSPYGEEERYIDPMALDDDIQPDVFFHDPSPAPRHEVASIMDLELNFSDPTVTESYESSAWSMAPNAHDVRYREGQRYSPNDVLTFQGGTAGQSCKPELRLTGSALQRSQIGDIPAFAPVKGEREPIGEVQPHECSQCRSNFPSLQLLDQHAKIESHKAWKCYEEGCGKAYARRDTFMRHQLKHGGSGHACGTCKRGGKDKVFKRKDHLAEHVRKCHGPGNDTSRLAPTELCAKDIGLTTV